MVHAFTSCGLLPQQYKAMSKAARIGLVNDHYIAGSMNFYIIHALSHAGMTCPHVRFAQNGGRKVG